MYEPKPRAVLLHPLLAPLLWFISSQLYAATYEPCTVMPPPPLREFRAAWVATVANIDWPSQKGLSTADQKTELVALLDRAVQLKLNAIIFQVRPACDAMYASPIEPWSEYLTGTMGKAPLPFYDPLAFAVEQAHKRGLQLHAWFNPYRARLPSPTSPAAANHISKSHPQLVRQYGKYLWLDPAEPAVQDYSLSVIMDVVKRYDIDGVHFDDYFYPYKEKDKSGKEMDFPDESSWRRLGAGGKLSREDWRRENLNTFIQRVYHSIKAAKPSVQFGISPFGIWRPGYPAQIQGYDAYAKLYADSRKWLANGWLDYFAPQLYWPIAPPDQSFSALLKWWHAQNTHQRHIWPGLDDTKTLASLRREGMATNRPARWNSEEILNQIRLTRKQSGTSGQVHWNMKSLMRNATLDAALLREVYAEPALVPQSPWLGNTPPGKPSLRIADVENGKLQANWSASGAEKASLWLLQTQSSNGDWKTEILPAHQSGRIFPAQGSSIIALSAVDRLGNASSPAALALKSHAPEQHVASNPNPNPPPEKPKRPTNRLASPKTRN